MFNNKQEHQKLRGAYLAVLVLGAVIIGGLVGYNAEQSRLGSQFQGKVSNSQQKPSSTKPTQLTPPPPQRKYVPNPEGQVVARMSQKFIAMGNQIDQVEWQIGDMRTALKYKYIDSYCTKQTETDYETCKAFLESFIGHGKENLRSALKTHFQTFKGKVDTFIENYGGTISGWLEDDVFANKVKAIVTSIDQATNFEKVVEVVSEKIQTHLTASDIRAIIQASNAYAIVSEAELRNKIKDVLDDQPFVTKINQIVETFQTYSPIDNKRDEFREKVAKSIEDAVAAAKNMNENDVFIKAIENIVNNVKTALKEGIQRGLDTAEQGLAEAYIEYLIEESELNKRYVDNRLSSYSVLNLETYIAQLNDIETKLTYLAPDGNTAMSGSEAINQAAKNSAPLHAALGGVEIGKYLVTLDSHTYLIKDMYDVLEYQGLDDTEKKRYDDLKAIENRIEVAKTKMLPDTANTLASLQPGDGVKQVPQLLTPLRKEVTGIELELKRVAVEVFSANM